MDHWDKFTTYYELADKMMEELPKEAVAECARFLAMNVAHYRSKFGALPLEESWSMLTTTMEVTKPAHAAILADGMETLVAVLGIAAGLGDDSAQQQQ